MRHLFCSRCLLCTKNSIINYGSLIQIDKCKGAFIHKPFFWIKYLLLLLLAPFTTLLLETFLDNPPSKYEVELFVVGKLKLLIPPLSQFLGRSSLPFGLCVCLRLLLVVQWYAIDISKFWSMAEAWNFANHLWWWWWCDETIDIKGENIFSL